MKMTEKQAQPVLSVRLSANDFEAFESHRQQLSEKMGTEVSRGALCRSLIEKQLVLLGAISEGGSLNRRQRSSMQSRLLLVESKLAAMTKTAKTDFDSAFTPFFR